MAEVIKDAKGRVVNEYDSGSCGLEDEVLGSCGQLKTAVKAKTKKSLAASQALRRIREAKKVANKREARRRAASTRVRVCVCLCVAAATNLMLSWAFRARPCAHLGVSVAALLWLSGSVRVLLCALGSAFLGSRCLCGSARGQLGKRMLRKPIPPWAPWAIVAQHLEEDRRNRSSR